MLIVQKALLVYIVVVSSISVRLLHIVCQASICYCHMREYPLFPAFYFFNLLPVLLLFSLHDVLSLKIFERRGTSSSALNQNILITFQSLTSCSKPPTVLVDRSKIPMVSLIFVTYGRYKI